MDKSSVLSNHKKHEGTRPVKNIENVDVDKPKKVVFEDKMKNDTEIVRQNTPSYFMELSKKWNTRPEQQNKNKFFASFIKNNQKLNNTPSNLLDFSIPHEPIIKNQPKDDFIYDLDIVDNQNRREKIKVTFQPGRVEALPSEVPNPLDKEFRDSFYRNFNFTTDYKSGYAPIEVQANQEKEFTYKNHFIKKKQSCANGSLKRVCGVSYVKKLESHQLNVNHIFPKLMPLVFQGSSGYTKLDDYYDLMKQSYDDIFEEAPNKYFLVTVLDAEDEGCMREYLYFPDRRMALANGKIYLMSSLDSLWYFLQDKHFICIHLVYDTKEFITKPKVNSLNDKEIEEALRKSNIHIGMICRKGLSGRRSFLKVFTEGLPNVEEYIESESEDEDHPPDGEAKELEKQKIKETKKIKIKKEKPPKKEKEEKKEQKEKKKEKGESKVLKPTIKKEEKKAKEYCLKARHLRFFNRVKPQLENNETLKQDNLKDMLENIDDIMQPYLKMLFLKNFKWPSINTDHTPLSTCTPSHKMDHTNELSLGLTTEKVSDEMTLETVSHSAIECPTVHRTETIETSDLKIISEEVKIQEVIADLNNAQSPLMKDEVKHESILHEQGSQADNKEQQQQANSVHSLPVQDPEEAVDDRVIIEKGRTKSIDDTPKDPLHKLIREIKKDPMKNLVTMSLRLELYTHEESWKTADEHTKNLIYTFILYVTDMMTERCRNWTLNRADFAKNPTSLEYSIPNDQIYLYEYNPTTFKGTKNEETRLRPSDINWCFDQNTKDLNIVKKLKTVNSIKGFEKTRAVSLSDIQGHSSHKDPTIFNLPLYLINTRDSFAFDLIEKVTEVNFCGRKVIRTDYYFDPKATPTNFKVFLDKFPDYYVGVTTYNNFFTHEELTAIENKCYATEKSFFSNEFLPMTGQMTCVTDKVRRTKFFFGARYMWTKQQLSEPHSMVGAGIRTDVSKIPQWMRDLVENPLVEAGIMEKDFINAVAMNVYHDGKEGIAQHFDDAVRFKQPIYSLRIFSDSRLSFGSQFYGFCNGAFSIPMPRGCITILDEGSYAANGVKHCVRPCDMSGKSAALILRQMHHRVFGEATLYDEYVDFPTWFSTLSIQDKAVSYSDQKKLEADELAKTKKKVDEAIISAKKSDETILDNKKPDE